MAALSKTQRRKRRLGIVGDVYAILIYTVLYIPVAVMMVFSFLDYICDPEVMAQNLEEFPYFCPNDAAVAAAPESYRNDPSKDFDYKENVFFQEDVGEALTIYNDYYQMLKVGE